MPGMKRRNMGMGYKHGGSLDMKKIKMAGGGMAEDMKAAGFKMMKDGGMPMNPETGKPVFVGDGKGKMGHGGMSYGKKEKMGHGGMSYGKKKKMGHGGMGMSMNSSDNERAMRLVREQDMKMQDMQRPSRGMMSAMSGRDRKMVHGGAAGALRKKKPASQTMARGSGAARPQMFRKNG